MRRGQPERQGQGSAGRGRAAGGRSRQGPSGSPARVVSSPGPDRSPPAYGRGAPQAYGRRLGEHFSLCCYNNNGTTCNRLLQQPRAALIDLTSDMLFSTLYDTRRTCQAVHVLQLTCSLFSDAATLDACCMSCFGGVTHVKSALHRPSVLICA